MKYLQLKEVTVSDELQPLSVYRGLEQDKIKINPGYLLMKQAINTLITVANGRQEQFHIIYKYEYEKLSVIFGIPENTENALISSLPGAVWEKIKYEELIKSGTRFVGSADPTILEEKKECLIDLVINAFHKEDFVIDFVITTIDELDVQLYSAYLDKTIQVLSQYRSSQLSSNPMIITAIIDSLKGGTKESQQADLANADISYIKYRQHFNSIHMLEKYMCTLHIAIYANDLSTIEAIGNIFQSQSANSGFISGHVLRKELNPKKSIKRHKEQWLRYINVINIKDQPKDAPGFAANSLEKKAEEFIDYIKKNKFEADPDDFDYVSLAEASSLLALPFSAKTGLIYRSETKYGTNPQIVSDKSGLNIGYLTTTWKTNIPIDIELKDLTRHVLVTGVTGSGKTTTIKHLLKNCINREVPFLVIEPAKSEYANWLKDLVIHKLGTPSNCLKMNPLAFPIGIHVQTHLDLIKSVFNAAFPMYGPMPYLLETALLKVYQNRGWDLVTGVNVFEKSVPREFCFPTLKELRDIIDQVTDNVGYSQDLTSDVRGALRVRLGSLIVGAKGQLLNTRQLIDLPEIMQKPSVLELEAIGDGQEKVFLMGLLLIQIYEYYISQGTQAYSDDLKHLMVFEEAHRLWENRQEAASQETVDVKGYAVQTMNQILSEIRAYGQGIMIADQIASKLAPDVVKNTNLKIIHRLFAHDDREWVGKSIGLYDEQIDDLVNLKKKEAVVFWDGLEKPVKVHIKVEKDILNYNIRNDENDDNKEDEALINLLMASEGFNEEAGRLLRTVFMFPGLINKIRDLIGSIANKYYLQVDIFENDNISKLLVLLILQRVQQWYLLGLISLLNDYEFSNKITSLKKPLEILSEFLEFGNAIARNSPEMPIYALVPEAKQIELLMPKGWDSNSNKDRLCILLQGTFNVGKPITQKNLERWIKINRCLELDKYFCINLLSEKEKDILADAAVTNMFKESNEILEHYLGVVNHYIDFHKPAKIHKRDEPEVCSEQSDNLQISITQKRLDRLEILSDISDNQNSETQHLDKIYYWVLFMGLINILLAVSIWFK